MASKAQREHSRHGDCCHAAGDHTGKLKWGELTVTEVLEDVLLAGELQLHLDVDGESGHLSRLQRKLGKGFL